MSCDPRNKTNKTATYKGLPTCSWITGNCLNINFKQKDTTPIENKKKTVSPSPSILIGLSTRNLIDSDILETITIANAKIMYNKIGFLNFSDIKIAGPITNT